MNRRQLLERFQISAANLRYYISRFIGCGDLNSETIVILERVILFRKIGFSITETQNLLHGVLSFREACANLTRKGNVPQSHLQLLQQLETEDIAQLRAQNYLEKLSTLEDSKITTASLKQDSIFWQNVHRKDNFILLLAALTVEFVFTLRHLASWVDGLLMVAAPFLFVFFKITIQTLCDYVKQCPLKKQKILKNVLLFVSALLSIFILAVIVFAVTLWVRSSMISHK